MKKQRRKLCTKWEKSPWNERKKKNWKTNQLKPFWLLWPRFLSHRFLRFSREKKVSAKHLQLKRFVFILIDSVFLLVIFFRSWHSFHFHVKGKECIEQKKWWKIARNNREWSTSRTKKNCEHNLTFFCQYFYFSSSSRFVLATLFKNFIIENENEESFRLRHTYIHLTFATQIGNETIFSLNRKLWKKRKTKQIQNQRYKLMCRSVIIE